MGPETRRAVAIAIAGRRESGHLDHGIIDCRYLQRMDIGEALEHRPDRIAGPMSDFRRRGCLR